MGREVSAEDSLVEHDPLSSALIPVGEARARFSLSPYWIVLSRSARSHEEAGCLVTCPAIGLAVGS